MPTIDTIALLATGNEVVNGDILNTNAHIIAQSCVDHGLKVGFHLAVSDSQAELEDAFALLMARHGVIICTGGLGPTSDDCTRHALAAVIHRPLVFDTTSWQKIVERFEWMKLPLHESNRQQALFPAGATVIPNPNGTAPGCWVEFQDKLLILLPGPPNECLPLLHQHVLPLLETRLPQDGYKIHKWRLFGVSEGEIAAYLDDALRGLPCSTGYRLDHPYLEFKIRVHQDDWSIVERVNELVEPYLLSDRQLPSDEVARQYFERLNTPLVVVDGATGGHIQTAWLRPSKKHTVFFNSEQAPQEGAIHLTIQGLAPYWQGVLEPGTSDLQLTWTLQGKGETQHYTLPYRPHRIIDYAVAFISHQAVAFLRTHPEFLYDEKSD